MNRRQLERLETAELERIAGDVAAILAERERAASEAPAAPADKRGREVVERRAGAGSGRWLQLEMVRCGKARCKRCAEGAGHGPYWYLYRPNPKTGRQTSEYVGKALPDELAAEFPDKLDSSGKFAARVVIADDGSLQTRGM